MSKKNKSNKAWINTHLNDTYVKQAIHHGYRSRAAFKLLELDAQETLFNNVELVVDLGCSPGSWSQVALEKLAHKKHSLVIGVDLLPCEKLVKHHFIQGNFTEQATLNQIIQTLNNNLVDLVLSDMAPNLSGIKTVDQAREAYLIELVLDFAKDYLKPGGNLLIKAFHGSEFNTLVKLARALFTKVTIKKPLSSRSNSSEIYLFCKQRNHLA